MEEKQDEEKRSRKSSTHSASSTSSKASSTKYPVKDELDDDEGRLQEQHSNYDTPWWHGHMIWIKKHTLQNQPHLEINTAQKF